MNKVEINLLSPEELLAAIEHSMQRELNRTERAVALNAALILGRDIQEKLPIFIAQAIQGVGK